MEFDPGFNIAPTENPLGFSYGNDVFGPKAENRKLDDIRKSLRYPNCSGPDIVYSIAMDVGKKKHKRILEEMHLLYGAVTYSAGTLGEEPVRSQGHIHAVSPLSGWSTPEIYEIWTGEAIVYMQEYAEDNPGRCFAVYAKPGDTVIVPPCWAHATISANVACPLTFGAWCDRSYGFYYDSIRRYKGLAWFPIIRNGEIGWEANSLYDKSRLVCKAPSDYHTFGIKKGEPIYTAFERSPETFLYVPYPGLKKDNWINFIP